MVINPGALQQRSIELNRVVRRRWLRGRANLRFLLSNALSWLSWMIQALLAALLSSLAWFLRQLPVGIDRLYSFFWWFIGWPHTGSGVWRYRARRGTDQLNLVAPWEVAALVVLSVMISTTPKMSLLAWERPWTVVLEMACKAVPAIYLVCRIAHRKHCRCVWDLEESRRLHREQLAQAQPPRQPHR